MSPFVLQGQNKKHGGEGWMAPIDAAPLAQGARSTGAGVSQLPGASSASASPSAAAPKEGAMTND